MADQQQNDDLKSLTDIQLERLKMCALTAMWGLGMVPRHIDSAIDGSTEPPSGLRTWLWVTVVTAYLGLASFTAFALANLTL